MAADEEWLSVAEAAQRLDKSERTIRRQCEAGKLRGRLDKTDSGKTWMVCLAPVEDVTESVTQSVTESVTSSTRSAEDSVTAAYLEEKTADIVPLAEHAQHLATATISENNSELLAQMSEMRHDVENIKIFLSGQMSAQMDKSLSALPTREDLREDVASIMGSALTPVMQRLEELAALNAQLETQLHAEKQKNLTQVCRPWWKKLFS